MVYETMGHEHDGYFSKSHGTGVCTKPDEHVLWPV